VLNSKFESGSSYPSFNRKMQCAKTSAVNPDFTSNCGNLHLGLASIALPSDIPVNFSAALRQAVVTQVEIESKT